MNARRGAAVAALALAAAVALAGCSAMNQQTRTCTVQSKDRTAKTKGGSDMRVYTDCGVFKVEDNVFAGVSSADIYGQLAPGRTYELETGGYRAGVLSSFPSIHKAREVPQ